MRASARGSSGAANVSAISSTGSRPSAPAAGSVSLGASISVASVVVWPSAVQRKRVRAGQASAGRNCSVRASSQVKAPGCDGASWTKRAGWSSGPPAAGPTSRAKNTVIGSQGRRKRSGTTTVPARPAGRCGGALDCPVPEPG